MFGAVGTWLFEGAASIALFVLLIPVFIAPFFAVVYRQYRYAPPGPVALAAFTGLYLCSLVAFTTFPLPESPQEFCGERATTDYWQTKLGDSLSGVLELLRDGGVAATLTSGPFLQVAFNVLFFVPLGFLVAYRMRRGAGSAIVAGLAVSLLIEVSQGTGLWGIYPCPYRLADVDDLIANTMGALLGWALGALIARRWPFRDPPPRQDLAAPTVRRRLLATGIDLSVVAVLALAVDIGVIVVEEWRGADAQSIKSAYVVVQYCVALTLLVALPLLRRDRATPGQLTVLLAVSSRDGGRAPAWSILVRFIVRWLPILIWGTAAFLAVVALELLTVWVRGDRRSLSGALARTTTDTQDGQLSPPHVVATDGQ